MAASRQRHDWPLPSEVSYLRFRSFSRGGRYSRDGGELWQGIHPIYSTFNTRDSDSDFEWITVILIPDPCHRSL